MFEMAYLPPQTQCSVKNYCAVVKLALQNASRLVFRRACFTGSQRQKNTYSANDAFATPALYVFLPDKYSIRIRGTTFVLVGCGEPVRNGGVCSLLAHSEHGGGCKRIKGEKHLALRQYGELTDAPHPLAWVCAIDAHSSMQVCFAS